MTHHEAEGVIKQADEERNRDCNEDDDECVRECRPVARPDDMRELFAHMLQIREW